MHRTVIAPAAARVVVLRALLPILTVSAVASGTIACGHSGPSLTERAQAAQQTASHGSVCAPLTPFYWEIGDATGALASGQGGDGSGSVDPDAAMPIASASKLMFGAYALQTKTLDEIVASGWDVFLNFTSGYSAPDDASCFLSSTVNDCFEAGDNDTRTLADVGKFFYGSSHLQAYAVQVAQLGGDYRSSGTGTPKLAADIQGVIGDVGLAYPIPLLAGGVSVSPSGYATFLRDVVAGKLNIKNHLGERAVCAWTHHEDCDALFSPVNESSPSAMTNDVSDSKWHYSLAHWVEDDGSFSSPGLFGFYPWIDASKTHYGIVARYDRATAAPPPAHGSSACGRAIREAWTTATPSD